MATYRLYWYPGSCARMPLVALLEIGASFESIVTDRVNGDAEFSQINEKEQVPALVTDDGVLTENAAIQTYLARRHPAARLLPAGDLEAEVRALELLSWFASGLHPLVRQLRLPRWYSADPAAHASLQQMAQQRLNAAFALLDKRLAGREWLFDRWSLVDVHLLWLWFRATGSGLPGSGFPNLAEHAARCETWPAVATALAMEERELERLREANLLPDWLPGFQAGHAPAFVR